MNGNNNGIFNYLNRGKLSVLSIHVMGKYLSECMWKVMISKMELWSQVKTKYEILLYLNLSDLITPQW